MTKPFWKDGVRFECQGTGRCCLSRGAYGYVYLTLADRRALAAHLGLRTAQFTRRYCRKTNGWFHLRHPERDCEFLDGKRCGVYEARPSQCRTWPFWPENMSPRVWAKDVVGFCAGVGRGRLYSAEEIEAILESARRSR